MGVMNFDNKCEYYCATVFIQMKIVTVLQVINQR